MPIALNQLARRLIVDGSTGLSQPVLVCGNPTKNEEITSINLVDIEDALAGTRTNVASAVAPTDDPLVYELLTFDGNPCPSHGLTLGRASSCDLVIREPSISRSHVRLLKRDGAWFVQDMGSKNGTWLFDLKLEAHREHKLSEEAWIRLGDVRLQFFTPDSFTDFLHRKLKFRLDEVEPQTQVVINAPQQQPAPPDSTQLLTLQRELAQMVRALESGGDHALVPLEKARAALAAAQQVLAGLDVGKR